MDIGSVMPMLRQQNGGGSVVKSSDLNGSKDGHWISENTYDIPGGKVDSVQESSVQSGPGWHTQASKKTTTMNQEFAAAAGSSSKGSSSSGL